MASKNVDTALAMYEGFNKRDLDAAVSSFAQEVTFIDNGMGRTHKSRAEFRESLQGWLTGFSDGKVTETKATDAGDTVIVQYIARGTNDGPMGSFQKTGRSVTVPFCDILQFDGQGRIVRGESYFDMYSMLAQLGHVPVPVSA
jgi:steroid delta-isomerase-like uncharacterized protein